MTQMENIRDPANDEIIGYKQLIIRANQSKIGNC